MNLLASLPKDHVVLSEVKLYHLIYFFVLSNISTDDDNKLICDYDVYDVYTKFEVSYEEEAIEEALTHLQKEGYITFDAKETVIYVGKKVGKEKKILSGNGVSIEAEFTRLMNYCKEYQKSARGVAVGHSERVETSLRKLYEKSTGAWDNEDAILFYQRVFEAIYQTHIRELTGKERGQLKNICSRYDMTTIAKMIVHYMEHSDKYIKTTPTVSTFLYSKDDIYSRISGKITTKPKIKERIEDDF